MPKYRAFLKRFPSLASLARSQQRSVMDAWSGLGYNRRARNLHQLAKAVQRDHAGKLPKTAQALRQLPGVGDYTAAAVLCFAYDAPVALVDVNVRRVLGRIFYGVHGPQRLTNVQVETLAASLIPPKRAVAWNSMLMDFGATVCTQRAPLCASCPVRDSCKAYPAMLHYRRAATKPIVRFVGSSRYWRGKMVTFLRGQKSHRAAAHAFRAQFQQLTARQYNALIASLVRDGIVRQTVKDICL